ncbi:Glyco_hydro_17 domain-containing protein, partial [Cephalotus follicularis]
FSIKYEIYNSVIGALHIRFCYGLNGDNLLSPTELVSLYKISGIEFMRLFEPLADVVEALRVSQLVVSIGTRKEDLENLASIQDVANSWVNTNIVPYKDDVSFKWITLGNEVILGPYASYVASALENIYNALQSIGLSKVKVTTLVPRSSLATSNPLLVGVFASDVSIVMNDVASFFARIGSVRN